MCARGGIVYIGQAEFGLDGLLTAKGRKNVDGGDWSSLDQVLNDVIAAVTTLDNGGFPRPVCAGAVAGLYNGLFRHYPGPTCCSSSTCAGCSRAASIRHRSRAAWLSIRASVR